MACRRLPPIYMPVIMPLLMGCLVSLGIKAAVVSAEAATVTRTGVCPARTRHGWLLGRKATVSPAK
jgi:hypothetical protein